MLLSKSVKILINHKNFKNFYNRGYINIEKGKIYNIKIDDISLNSHINVNIKCDKCFLEKQYKYQAYNWYTKNQTIPYYCNKCNGDRIKKSFKEKYGVENPFQSEEVKAKIKKIKIEKYGDANYNNNKKATETNMRKYNVTSPCKNINIKEKQKITINSKTFKEKEEIKEKRKQTCLAKYGVKNVSQKEEIKEKRKQTNLIKYGKTCSLHTIEGKLKTKQTNLKKYGVEHPVNSNIIKEKIKQTNLKNYGVEHPSQNIDFFEKHQKNRFLRIEYLSSNIWYQGSYELDFLEHYYDKFLDMSRAPIIKYIMNDKNKVYFPDFYIPSLNLIIEIKNSYLVSRYKEEIELKEKAAITNGFNYIIIIDKDYTNFNKLILNEQPNENVSNI